MAKKHHTEQLVPTKMETFGSQPSSHEERESPKGSIPSLQSFENLASYRSDASNLKDSSPMHHLKSVTDFKRSLEKEKSIGHLMNKFESIANDPDGVLPKGAEKVISVMEKNYSLQIQTLLEQVNKLKLEKKIIEKKLTKSSTVRSIANSRNELRESPPDNFKMTLGAKNSTINELEFQLEQLQSENSNLKMIVHSHKAELEKMTEGMHEYSNLKCQVDDNCDEIELLKQKLEMKDSVQTKLMQELQQLRNENMQFKFKSQNNSFIGGSEKQSRHQSRETSFISTTPEPGRYYNNTHNRMHSEHLTWIPTKCTDLTSSNLKASLGGLEQNHHMLATYTYSRKKASRDTSLMNNTSNDASFTRIKSRLSSLGSNSCLKVLNEYEKQLYKELQSSPEMRRKIANRLLELKKLKTHCIEQENLRLMSILKERAKPNKFETQNYRFEDSLIVGKSAELDLSYALNDNFES